MALGLKPPVLKALKELHEGVLKDPSVLEDPSLSLPEWVRSALKREVKGLQFLEADAEPEQDNEDGQKLEEWIDNLLEDLETMRGQGIGSLEPAQQNTYFRLAGAMTEKLLTQRERLNNVELAREFMTTVTSLLEEMVPEDVSAEFMARLEADIERRRGA